MIPYIELPRYKWHAGSGGRWIRKVFGGGRWRRCVEEADGGGRWGKEMVEVDGGGGEDVVGGGRKW